MEGIEKYERLFNRPYRFAKTCVTFPHFYIVREYLKFDDRKLYDEFGTYIEQNGYKKKRYGTEYTYLKVGGYKYRMMGNILNRTPLTEEQLRIDIEPYEKYIKEGVEYVVEMHKRKNMD